jgi:hypothetical protein
MVLLIIKNKNKILNNLHNLSIDLMGEIILKNKVKIKMFNKIKLINIKKIILLH